MPNLTIISGPAAGQKAEVVGELVIGREHADLDIDDPEVSRQHTLLRVVDEGVEVEDLGSMNGTFVNDERIAGRVTLAETSKLRVGTTEMELEIVQAEPEPIAQPDVTAPRQTIPQPDVTAPRQAIPQPDVTAPREAVPDPEAPPSEEIPQPDVTAPRQIPQPDVTAPRQAIPQPDVTAPRQTIPEPDVTAPRQTIPEPDVTAPRQVPTGEPPPSEGPTVVDRPARSAPSPALLLIGGILIGAAIVVLIVLLA
jgi:Inner membrane component of T3SS, cytoplasmic domain